MNDRQDPYGQVAGYDEYGRPLYHPDPHQAGYGHDPYAAPPTGGQPGYDPYAAPDGQVSYPQGGASYGDPGYPAPAHHDPYGAYPGTSYADPYGAPAPDPGGYPGYGGAPADGGSWGGQGPDGLAVTGYGTGGPTATGYPGDPAAGYSGGDPAAGYHPGGAGPSGYEAGGAGYDPGYGTGPQPAVPASEWDHPAGTGGYGGWESGDTGPQPPVPDGGATATATGAPSDTVPGVPAPRDAEPRDAVSGVPAPRDAADDATDTDYRTEQFAFVEEDDTESEEVIDWLKFTESRTERREDAKRRAVGRRRLLVILLVLAVLGAGGFLYVTDRVPFLSGPGEEAAEDAAAESRDVIILHLRETGGDTTSTALLVANETTGESTTLLLPNATVVASDSGTTTLGQAVQDEGAASVRSAVGTLLGADIKGTWRLDTPYLENLVDLAGGVTVSVDTEVPGDDDEPLVEEGEQRMDGRTAVAYALYRAEDEPQDAQLERFGAVLGGVLDELPSSEEGAQQVVESLAQIADPSLSENDLGVSLAQLAGMAQDGGHTTTPLPLEEDGSLSDEVAEELVADVLGGTVTEADLDGTPRVALRDGSGSETAGESARISLVNGGYTLVDNRESDPVDTTEVRYEAEPFAETAREVARTLGIPEDAVVEGGTPGSSDVAVVLGGDFDS